MLSRRASSAATGARGLRVLNEAAGVGEMVLTDSHPAAFEVLERNAGPFRTLGAVARHRDARRPIETSAFDYVDLDPYGSPLPYLDSALEALRPGGVLAVTAIHTNQFARSWASRCRNFTVAPWAPFLIFAASPILGLRCGRARDWATAIGSSCP